MVFISYLSNVKVHFSKVDITKRMDHKHLLVKMFLTVLDFFFKFFLASSGLIVVYLWIKDVKMRKKLSWTQLPNVPPIIGVGLDIKNTLDILPTLDRYLAEKNSKLVVLPILNRYFFICKDYKLMEFVMGSTKIINKSEQYYFLENWLGTGLLTAKAEKWRPRRKILTPAFHFSILETFVDVFDRNSDILIRKLAEEVGKDSFNVYTYITLCALDIICETSMGVSVNAQKDAESEYVRSVKSLCQIAMNRIFSPMKIVDFLYQFTKDYRIERKALKVVHSYTDSMIEKRAEELRVQNTDKSSISEAEVGVKRKKGFLDLLLEARIDGQPLSNADIREEVDTLMFEGHDTTASAMSFALYCLANNPEVQKKAVQEQIEMLDGELNRPVTHRDLMNMKYLELVIKETLRLYPSVPFYGRNFDQDIEYEGNIIPKGCTFAAYVYGMNRDPDFYPEPEKFDPSRFEDVDGTKPYSYLSFSAGPRNCIGQKFAMLEMKSTISKVLRNYELRPAFPEHKLVLAAETVLKSANGINISLKKRVLKTV